MLKGQRSRSPALTRCKPFYFLSLLASGRFVVYLYRQKDGALRKVTLRPSGKLDGLCWTSGVGGVNNGSVPLVALKVLSSACPVSFRVPTSVLALLITH